MIFPLSFQYLPFWPAMGADVQIGWWGQHPNRRLNMIGVLFNTEGISGYKTLDPGSMTELVRGNEQLLLERFLPLVREQSITLNLRKVERIDAAGLASLIRLYCASRDAGHNFSITNPTPRVAQFLALVHLDGLLVSGRADESLCSRLKLQESAA
jgi:anti-anti-sigma regulatory factor